jgi:hypothetical protein
MRGVLSLLFIENRGEFVATLYLVGLVFFVVHRKSENSLLIFIYWVGLAQFSVPVLTSGLRLNRTNRRGPYN